MTVSDKAELRTQLKERRDRVAASRATDGVALANARDQVWSLAPSSPPFVSGYLPIGSEIDVISLMQALCTSGATLCLPVVVAPSEPLIFRIWQPGAPLVERMWGLREPEVTATQCTPDLLLVPLLGIDGEGYRLGYGGGFYDRTLERLRAHHKVVAIGVAFDEQMVDAVPREAYDQPMDYILTPRGLFKSGGSTKVCQSNASAVSG